MNEPNERSDAVIDLLAEAVPMLLEADNELVQPVTDLCRACIKIGRAHGINPTLVIAWAIGKSITAIRNNDDVAEVIDIATAMTLYQVQDVQSGRPGVVSVKIKENPDPKDVS